MKTIELIDYQTHVTTVKSEKCSFVISLHMHGCVRSVDAAALTKCWALMVMCTTINR